MLCLLVQWEETRTYPDNNFEVRLLRLRYVNVKGWLRFSERIIIVEWYLDVNANERVLGQTSS